MHNIIKTTILLIKLIRYVVATAHTHKEVSPQQLCIVITFAILAFFLYQKKGFLFFFIKRGQL